MRRWLLRRNAFLGAIGDATLFVNLGCSVFVAVRKDMLCLVSRKVESRNVCMHFTKIGRVGCLLVLGFTSASAAVVDASGEKGRQTEKECAADKNESVAAI